MKPPGSVEKAPVFPPEKIISYRQFIADFATSHRIGGAHPFCFLIGAGASRDAGIPTGSQFANTWLREIFQTEGPADKRLPAPDTVQGEKAADRIIRLSAFLPDEEKRLGEWAENHLAPEPDFAGFAWKNRAAFYGALYARRYRTNSDLGQADLRGIIIGARPTAAYLLLARILADTKHRLVVTTNFDRLTEDAVAIIKGTAALTLGHEKIAPFLDTAYELPMVAKVHGDIFLETYNAENDIRDLRAEWQDALRRVLQSHTPIIIGYGGNDPGLMKFFADNADAYFRRRAFYWLYHEPTGVPENDLVHKLAKTHGFRLVPVPGFEHTMQALNDALGYPPLLDDIDKISASLRAQIENPDGKQGKGGRGASSQSMQSSGGDSREGAKGIPIEAGPKEREAIEKGRELNAKGHYREAESLLRKLYEESLRTHGPESEITLEAAYELAESLL